MQPLFKRTQYAINILCNGIPVPLSLTPAPIAIAQQDVISEVQEIANTARTIVKERSKTKYGNLQVFTDGVLTITTDLKTQYVIIVIWTDGGSDRIFDVAANGRLDLFVRDVVVGESCVNWIDWLKEIAAQPNAADFGLDVELQMESDR
jgi:hypothetical protein